MNCEGPQALRAGRQFAKVLCNRRNLSAAEPATSPQVLNLRTAICNRAQTVSNLCMLTSLIYHQYMSTWEFTREQYYNPFCSLFIQMILLLMFLMHFLLFMLMTHLWDVELRLHLTLNQL